jgi:signal transduction histidine kinase/CheY-like chemotaxis protein
MAMNYKKSYIPIKVFISYLVLSILVIVTGWVLYTENKVFYETEGKLIAEKDKIIEVSNLFSDIYKTESLARRTIQSNSEIDFKNFTKQTQYLNSNIDSLKLKVNNKYQTILLDSVKYLLSKKTDNIKQLKLIKSEANDEIAVKNAINDLTKMEASLRKLQVKDFTKYPEAMGDYQLKVLKKYVNYLNQNIPDDSTNTLSKKASDSIIAASKTLLNQVKTETEKKKKSLNNEENKLLQNELSISDQLRKILNVIEREIIITTTKTNSEKQISLKRTNKIVTIAAVFGLLLTIFFSVLILNDFSKTELYKSQLEIANTKTKILLKNREQLISTVSHDLKTPLSTILGYTELLDNSELNNKQSYYTKNIKGSSKYISQLVQDLLDFTQIETGKITLEYIPFSLKNVISEVAVSIKSIYKQKRIELIIDIEDKLEKNIISDPFRLRQVFTNIIGNAYKFTETGFIKIVAKSNTEKNLIEITIEDSGIGIEKSKQELVFEEFTQADQSIEKKYGGTGLGLTISKKIIEFLHGKLYLESDINKGSVFHIEIPLKYEEPKIVNTPPIKSNFDIKEITAVVVDDDPNLLGLTTEILRQNQIKVLAYSNPLKALSAIENNAFDIVLTDIQMPEIDGFEFLEKLKKSKFYSYTNQPVIAITGRADLDQNIYKNAGFSHVVNKPYSPKILVEIITSILNKKPITMNQTNQNNQKEKFDKDFSLQSLKSFLPNETLALNNVLSSFMINTIESIESMENALLDNNLERIKEISHRMYPMFKQIESNEIAQILQNIERKDFTFTELEFIIKSLKFKIDNLFLLLEKELVV